MTHRYFIVCEGDPGDSAWVIVDVTGEDTEAARREFGMAHDFGTPAFPRPWIAAVLETQSPLHAYQEDRVGVRLLPWRTPGVRDRVAGGLAQVDHCR